MPAAAVRDRAAALQTLGLDSHSTPRDMEIKRAFHQEVRKSHPDRPSGDAARFQAVKEAYDFLQGRAGSSEGAAPSTNKPRWGSVDPYASGEYMQPRKEPGSWGWVPHTEEVPVDLHEVWATTEYNPYSGAYYGPQDPPDAPWVKQSGAAASQPRAASAAPAAAAPPTRSPRASQAHAYNDLGATGWFIAGLIACMISMQVSLSPIQPRATQLPVVDGVWRKEEPLQGIEYALAASMAKAGTSPVLLSSLPPAPPALQKWLAQPGRVLAGLEGEKLDMDYLEQIWHRHGKEERTQLIAHTLQAALDETQPSWGAVSGGKSGLPKFATVVAIVNEGHSSDVLNTLLAGNEGLKPSDEDLLLSDRHVIRLRRPATGQEVLFVEAANAAESLAEERVGNGLPELREAMQRVRPDAVMLDMSLEDWQELREEFAVWTGVDVREGVRVLGPQELKHFKAPAWTGLKGAAA